MAKIALLALNQAGIATARRLMKVLPEAILYGSASRTTGADETFEHFKPTVQELFEADVPVVGLCAAGILIRSIAPLLQDKQHEPAVIAVASDGSAVVPLLGGLHGANELAARLAAVLTIEPAITTTGDLRFQTALLSPPPGYVLTNPDAGMQFLADCIAGEAVRIEGHAPWLANSQLPQAEEARLRILVTDRAVPIAPDCLVYHPATIVAVVEATAPETGDLVEMVESIFRAKQLAIGSLAGVITTTGGNESIRALARHYQVPLRITDGSWQEGNALRAKQGAFKITLRRLKKPVPIESIGRGLGQLRVVGLGPGAATWLTPEVKEILQNSTDWVGYTTYLNLAEPWRRGQQRHDSDNREELDRARQALNLAATGKSVVVISSGDPGIFAMAAAVMEAIDQDRNPAWALVDLNISPGLSAMQAAAAQAGAPLGHDFCVISLSDVLKPWPVVERRLILAAQGDFAIAIYNPISSERPWQLPKAIDLLCQYRAKSTPVVVAQNLGRTGQQVMIKTLGTLSAEDADMRTTILVGSSQTKLIEQPGQRSWVYTPRFYH
jgi:cobalt-precorrin 5A hydrolase / precorrin-3B C17-methyltransferase